MQFWYLRYTSLLTGWLIDWICKIIIKIRIEDNFRQLSGQFFCYFRVEGSVLDCPQSEVEAGEGVPRRTDGDQGEGEVRDGPIVDSRGDGILPPAGIRLLDHHSSRNEAAHDDEHPEEPGQLVRCGNVGQPVDGWGLEELLHNLHTAGLSDTEQNTFLVSLFIGWLSLLYILHNAHHSLL